MKQASTSLFRALDGAMVLCLCGMVVMVFGNVVLRYGFNSGISSSEELSRFLFVWLTFLGAIAALRNLDHLGVDSLLRVLPRAGKVACAVASALIALAICVLIAHGSWKMTALNLDNIAPVTGLPMAVVYASGLVFAISAIGLLSKRIYRVLFAHVSEQELLGVKESEELADHAPAH